MIFLKKFSLEARHQLGEHRSGLLPAIEAILELASSKPTCVPLRPLQDQPKSLNVVNVIDPAHILLRPVFDRNDL